MVRSLAEFLRLRLLPTAAGDVLAGAFLAGATSPGPVLSALVVSGCLYLFGMATNSILDRERDARLYPTRPLPAGTLSLLEARVVAAMLLGGALAASWWLPSSGKVVAGVLLLTILAYNRGGKRLFLVGPTLMGSCRGLNLYLGVATAGDPLTVTGETLAAAGILGGYVACLTQISAWEGTDTARAKLRALVGAMAPLPVLLPVFFWGGAVSLVPAAGLAFLVAVAFPRAAFSRGTADKRPVHNLLSGVYILDAAYLARAGQTILCFVFTLLGVLPHLVRQMRRTAGAAGGEIATRRSDFS